MPSAEQITGLVLAGGLGRRMGGVDKGLQLYQGQPLVAHVLARLAPQVGQVLISANRNRDTYARFGHPVVGDAMEGFLGPLAGLERGMTESTTDWVAMAPCDTPALPSDLVSQLAAALPEGARAIMPTADGRDQPTFLLVHCALLPQLRDYLSAGGRRMLDWASTVGAVTCPFGNPADFANFNTRDDLGQKV